jgi:hypothetical protein
MIKKVSPPQEGGYGIKRSTEADAILRFSFKLFDVTDDEMCPDVFDERYTRTLMERLRDLSSWKVSTFTGRCVKAVRNHLIDWNGTSRPDGFSQLNEQYRAYPAYQFSLSANEHGRVHGIIIDDTFYVIWLDCNHSLYQ